MFRSHHIDFKFKSSLIIIAVKIVEPLGLAKLSFLIGRWTRKSFLSFLVYLVKRENYEKCNFNQDKNLI